MAERGNSSCPGLLKKRKTNLKCCEKCGLMQPVAKRKCQREECGNIFERKVKDIEKIKNKGKTNITDQRKKMEYRADILKLHHDCDTIILTHRKHGLGYTVSAYGTEGLAELFIGTNTSNRSKEGQAIVMLFERFMAVQKSKKRVDDAPLSSVSSQSIPPDKTCTSTHNEEIHLTPQPEPSHQENVSTTSDNETVELNQNILPETPTTGTSQNKNPNVPTTPSLSNIPISKTIDTPKHTTFNLSVPNIGYTPNAGERVIVIGEHDGKAQLFGAGIVMPGRQLHFNNIRDNCSKISLTSISVKDNNAKPFYPDKNDENQLVCGQLYEWPNTFLFPLLRSDDKVNAQ